MFNIIYFILIINAKFDLVLIIHAYFWEIVIFIIIFFHHINET
jgi:hypothetical protein